MGRELGVFFKLLEGCPDTRRRGALGPLEAALGYEALDLARIGLVLDAVVHPADDPVQHTPFLLVAARWAEPGTDVELVLLAHRCLQPVEGWLGSTRREVVPVHAGGYLPLWVVEDIRAGVPLSKTKADEECAVLLLPSISGRASPIHVSQQLGTHVFVAGLLLG